MMALFLLLTQILGSFAEVKRHIDSRSTGSSVSRPSTFAECDLGEVNEDAIFPPSYRSDLR